MKVSKRLWKGISTTLWVIFLIAFSVIMLAPFAWMVSTAFKPAHEVLAFPPVWIPKNPTLSNFPKVLQRAPFAQYFINSGIISSTVTLGTLFFCSLGGFAFAHYDFPGRDLIFTMILATLMVPFAVTMIPLYTMMHRLRWLDTYYPLIVPGLSSAFGIFLMRQFMIGIPSDYVDAARIDGCSEFGIYRRIIVPLSKPVFATLGVFTFMGQWNDFLWPLLILKTKEKFTLPIGLAMFRHATYGFAEMNLLMMGAVISTIPVLIIYIFAQRYFVQGLTLSGIKG